MSKTSIAQKSKYFSYESLENMSKFQYKAQNSSLLYKYITSPLLDILVSYFPSWVAPNSLTLASLIVNLIPFFVILFECGNDFSATVSRWTCLLQSITHLLYIILDNSDGKQARKTGTSSSLGLLLDHGCDAFTTCVIAINIAHILQLGNGFVTILVFFCMNFSFWVCTYEEYVVGYLNLGMINGADEGVFVVFLIALFSAILGTEFWKMDTLLGLTIIQIMISCVVIASIYQILSSLHNILTNKGLKSVYNLIVDSWLMIFILQLPFINWIVFKENSQDYLTITLYVVSMMFCRVTIQLQCDIVGKQIFKNRFIFVSICNVICLVIVLIFKMSPNFFNYFPLGIAYAIVLIILIGTTFHFLYDGIETITSFLGIRFLSITPYDLTPDVNTTTTV